MSTYDPTMDIVEPGTPIGWRVLDPDGNVVASGPITELVAVSDYGQEQEESDGCN